MNGDEIYSAYLRGVYAGDDREPSQEQLDRAGEQFEQWLEKVLDVAVGMAYAAEADEAEQMPGSMQVPIGMLARLFREKADTLLERGGVKTSG